MSPDPADRSPTDSLADQQERATAFHGLHDIGILVLPNSWDVASARIAEVAGARAIATTSAGVAWALGFADGEGMSRDRALAVVASTVAAVNVPVSADIESGYAATLDELAATITAVLATGAVGINLEDSDDDGLRSIDVQSDRIATARSTADAASVRLFINARTDTYLRGGGAGPAERLRESIERANAYVQAGADGIFVPGASDREVIRALVDAAPIPLNVMAGPGSPTVAELADLGVRRVSVGSATAQAAYGIARRAAMEVLQSGTYDALSDGMDYGQLNALFARG